MQGATPVPAVGVLADQPDKAAAFARRGLGRALEPTATRGEIADAVAAVPGDPGHADVATGPGSVRR
ncbi:hypothetical protein AB0F71_30290 [Kitasatospora sp. NPDC028055]|uniref:hypothetical protein n=1 Tax=Kitasatospora sp. NPDC028055 TaxID=3155653 RepID=UPI0033D925E9